jgi:uncharacterized protein
MRYAVFALIAINVIFFLVQNTVPGFTDSFVLVSSDVAARPWLLITSTFLHDGAAHILGNMFALFVFGIILENLVGTKKFLAIYFAAGLVASLAATLFYDVSLGASGAIFGVLGALAAMRPKMTVWTYGVPMPMVVAAGFWLALDIIGVFSPSNVANAAHIAGLIFGAAIGIALKIKEPRQPKSASRRRELSDEDLDQWEETWM